VSFFVSGKTIPEEPNTLPSIHSLPFIMGAIKQHCCLLLHYLDCLTSWIIPLMFINSTLWVCASYPIIPHVDKTKFSALFRIQTCNAKLTSSSSTCNVTLRRRSSRDVPNLNNACLCNRRTHD
jgi:hypothetical protein